MDPSTTRRSLAGISRSKLLSWAAAFGVGAYLGYGIAYSLTLTGLGSLGAYVAVLIAAAILVTLAVMAVMAALVPDKRGRPAARALVIAGVLLVLGVASGWAITSVLGLGYHEPTVREAQGTMNLSLDGIDGYVSGGDALAYCRSESAGTFPYIEADLVGKVGSEQVVASIFIPPDSPDGRPVVNVWVQPANKTEEAAPQWRGPADVVEPIDGDRGGRMVFTNATLTASEEGGRPPEGWPAVVSGNLTWSCRDWSGPGATPQP